MEQQENINKLKEQYPSFFEAFSFKLIDFVLSGKMAQKIANICIENRIFDQEKIEKLSYHITYVIFNKVPKERLPSVIEEELETSKEVALKITETVDLLILSQINKLSEEEKEEEIKEEEKKAPSIPVASKPSGNDSYREPVE